MLGEFTNLETHPLRKGYHFGQRSAVGGSVPGGEVAVIVDGGLGGGDAHGDHDGAEEGC